MLDQIVAETMNGQRASDARSLYRGKAIELPENTSGLEQVLNAAHLNWKVCELPVMIQGKHEARAFPGRKALVRCDNGHPIEIVSDKFKVHQNDEIVGGLLDVVNAAKVKITHGGSLDGGAVVFLHGTLDKQFSVGRKVGDIVRLDVRVKGGHRPGTPSELSAMAMRLVCLNGATFADRSMVVRVTHRQKFGGDNVARVREFIENAVNAFDIYGEKSQLLSSAAMNRDETKAYVIGLIQPEILRRAVDGVSELPSHAVIGREVIDRIVSSDMLMRTAVSMSKEAPGARTVNAILASVDSQPGAELARGKAWNAYNGVTYYVDHVRGRGEVDSAVESAISGEGATLKSKALDLAVEYAMARVQ